MNIDSPGEYPRLRLPHLSSDNDTPQEKPSRFRKHILIALAFFVFPLLVTTAFFAAANLFPAPISFQFGGTETGPAQAVSIGQQTVSTGPENNPPLRNAPFPSFLSQNFPYVPAMNYGEVLLAAALLLVFALLYRALRSRSRRLSPFEDDELKDERLKVAAILDEAAANLTSGSGYRETVLRCYKMISQVLEKKSALDGRALTAREFRKEVSQKLRFDSPYLSKATDLFEVARYSLDEITIGEAQAASECLLSLSASLKETIDATDTTSELIGGS